jgi:hypothetical protein
MELILPEYAKYIYEINYLRLKLARSIAHRDALKYHICKYIELDYMLKVGALEYKQMVVENKVNKASRMLYYLKEQKLKPNELPKIIKKEFEEDDKKVELMEKSVNDAIDMSFKKIPSEDEVTELNSHYLLLVKDYSPEINSKNTDEENHLFDEILNAYKSGNVRQIKKFDKCTKDELYFDELEAYKAEEIKLNEVKAKVDREILEIKNKFPYTEKIELQDENLFRRRKEGINAKIQELESELEALQKELKKL